MTLTWHALLAALPPEAVPARKPLGPASGDQPGNPLAGWSELVLELSAGAGGLRVLQVVLDAESRPIAASDLVYHPATSAQTSAASEPALSRQESLGGRFEPDGTFKGTYWRGTAPAAGEVEAAAWQLLPNPPTPVQVEALRNLVAELVRRAGVRT